MLLRKLRASLLQNMLSGHYFIQPNKLKWTAKFNARKTQLVSFHG